MYLSVGTFDPEEDEGVGLGALWMGFSISLMQAAGGRGVVTVGSGKCCKGRGVGVEALVVVSSISSMSSSSSKSISSSHTVTKITDQLSFFS